VHNVTISTGPKLPADRPRRCIPERRDNLRVRLMIALALMLFPLSFRLGAIRAFRSKGKPIAHP
jgi:hypothetical protein